MTTKKSLQIHTENILPIIKKWLYSDKDIFVRELVSNACDAIYKTKILCDSGEISIQNSEEQNTESHSEQCQHCEDHSHTDDHAHDHSHDHDQAQAQSPSKPAAPKSPFHINIKIDKEKRTLTFTDNGIGMDAEEVQKYIAQIAFSGAEEFVSKYKSNVEKDQVIGHFGLGFYSAFMVASKVEINTLSYKADAEPVLWSCDGSTEYEIGKGTKTTRGTEITLFLDDSSDEYLDEEHLSKILHHYCDYLPYPIYLDGEHINSTEPLWVKSPNECTTEEYLDFYRHLYPMDEDPLFWIHLNVDYPFHLKGILYFPKIRRDYDFNKSTIKLFCNRVFVSDNCKDVLPNYLMVLRGAIDSPDIPLNVSRSYLQMDRTVRQLAGHVSKKVSDSLVNLYQDDKERFLKCWDDVSMIVKLGALEDEKFYDRVKSILLWKTADGAWTTAEEYLERNRETTKDKILYTQEDEHHSHFLEAYRHKNIEVLCAKHYIDSYLMAFLEKKLSPATFQRIDSEIDESILDKSREKTVADESGKTEATILAEFVRAKLGDEEQIEVEAKSLSSDAFPGFITMNEQQRRMREYMQRTMDSADTNGMMGMFGKRTFIVNTNNSLITAIHKLDATNPALAKDLVKEVYELALLSQKEMGPELLNAFVTRTSRILEQLIQK